MFDGSRAKAINTSDSVGDDTIFGECLKLLYYSGTIEDWMVATNVFHIVINIISAMITVVANTTFLVTYFTTPSLRNPHNFFLMLLAITDISVGLVSQPLFIARKIMEIHNIHNCALWAVYQGTVFCFSGISLLTVTLVSIERYLAVYRPIKHRNEVTPNRMAIVAFSVWVLWLPFPILRFVFPEFYRVFGMFTGGIVLVLFALNACIYVKIYRRFSGNKFQNDTIRLPKVNRETYLKKEARLAKISVCLLLVMSLAYLPFFMAMVYKAVAGADTLYIFVIKPFTDTSVLLNSSFNPLFYCFRNMTIREAICMRINGYKPRFVNNSVILRSTRV